MKEHTQVCSCLPAYGSTCMHVCTSHVHIFIRKPYIIYMAACMHICMQHAWMCVHMYVVTPAYVCTKMCVHACVCTCTHGYVCANEQVHADMCVHVHLNTCARLCVCMHSCMQGSRSRRHTLLHQDRPLVEHRALPPRCAPGRHASSSLLTALGGQEPMSYGCVALGGPTIPSGLHSLIMGGRKGHPALAAPRGFAVIGLSL